MRRTASVILTSRARTGFGWGKAVGVDGCDGSWKLSGLWCMIVIYHHSMAVLPLQPMRSLRIVPRPHMAADMESIRTEYVLPQMKVLPKRVSLPHDSGY